mmetsp:Transcript_8850/g.25729  ORF Transcript_8850/g.25729 Transcript_8850/m.25729 type:complete len:132 (+) Transcript_8850:82-477(+)
MDKMGNKYYENLEYPFPQHRWVEFKDIHNFDASMIPPEWHGWVHHTYDEPPTEAIAKPALEATAEQVHTPFDHHVGHVSEDFVPENMHNTTQKRARGYGVGNANLYMDPEDPDEYYKQTSHPMNVVPKKKE